MIRCSVRGLEGLGGQFNRILCGLPNIPKLTWVASGPRGRGLQKIPSLPIFACRFFPRVVNLSMNASPIAVVEQSQRVCIRALSPLPGRAGGESGPDGRSIWIRDRHATCMTPVFLEKDSHSLHESVDFCQRRAKVGQGFAESRAAGSRRSAERCTIGRQSGWDHGAARNGNRKRTRVRVACGGGIRPRGLGHQPIHGHFGLSVVGRGTFSPVVHLPACEFRVRQRHFSRGPGLLAALTSRHDRVASRDTAARMSAHERHPAHHQTVWATRPAGYTVIRAASVLKGPPERPAAGRSAHQPSPRTRLRSG